MSLQPKFSFDKTQRKYIAQKEFTDRELPQETFLRNISELTDNIHIQSPTHKILVYYGVGGIGKTSLKEKLKEKTLEMSNSLVLEIDFRNIRSRECATGLWDLYWSLKENSTRTIKMPHFELAYAIYFKKKYSTKHFNDEKESPFENFDLGVGILNFLDPIGGVVGLVKSTIDSVYRISKNKLLDENKKEQFKEFISMPLNHMEEWLPAFFADDLKMNIAKMQEIKTVIFMDTFEAVYESETHELKKVAKTGWIQELIAHLPNVLFTIFGRDKISWDGDWNRYLDQHLLSELTESYTELFLEKCGVKEDIIRKKITKASKGHPYYLDLSVDTYFSIKNRGEAPNVANFGNEEKDILKRFITNLNTTEVELLKVMSIPNYFNFEIFGLLINKFEIPYATTQFSYFNQYSFITSNETSKKHYIHQLMREGMESFIDRELYRTVHLELFNYFERKYEYDEDNYLFECIYHKLKLSDGPTFFEWLKETKLQHLKRLQLFGDTVLLTSAFSEIRKAYGAAVFPIELFNVYEDIIHLAGNYKESVELAERYISRYSTDEIYNDKNLIRLSYRIIHHKMFYVNADILIEQLKHILANLSTDKYLDEYCEVLYMLGGGVGFLTGKHKLSKGYLDRLMMILDSQPHLNRNLKNIRLRAVRKIVDFYRVVGDFEKAEEVCVKYLDEDKLNRYQIYLLCSKGEILRARKNYAESEKCFIKVLKATKASGIKGWTAHAYLALANLYLENNNIAEAKNNLDNAQLIYNELSHQWGMVNSKIMLARIFLTENNDQHIHVLKEAKEIAELFSYRHELNMINLILENSSIGEQQLLYV